MIFVYIFIGLIVLLLIMAAMMPKGFHIEKTITIDAPKSEVMEKVGDLNYYSQWNPWQQMDPNAKKTITGIAGRNDHAYAWEGKKVGKGELRFLSGDSNHLHFKLQFIKPWKSIANDNWQFEDWGADGTKVTWQNSGELPWPIARLMGPMLNKSLSRQLEKGLANLKSMVESRN